MKSLPAFYIPLLVSAMLVSTPGLAQEKAGSVELTIVLSKKSYIVGEPVVVTYKLSNLSNSLVCFYPPAIDCYSLYGELAASATPPKGVNGVKHYGGCSADRMGESSWGSDIDEHWIKLGPLQSHEITKESRLIGLTAPGKWTVEAGYVAMNTNGLPELQKALNDRGCGIVPELHSVRVTVVVKGNDAK